MIFVIYQQITVAYTLVLLCVPLIKRFALVSGWSLLFFRKGTGPSIVYFPNDIRKEEYLSKFLLSLLEVIQRP